MNWELIAGATLIGIVFAYLSFLGSIAFRRTSVRNSPPLPQPPNPLSKLLVTCNPDCELALLWQTQTPILERLKEVPDGLSVPDLSRLYCSFCTSYPELCEGCDFDAWLSALERSEVARRRDRIAITEKGLFMLDFAKQQGTCPCDELTLVQPR